MTDPDADRMLLAPSIRVAVARQIILRGAIGMVAVTTVLFFVWYQFADRIDPVLFVSWLIVAAIGPLGFAIINVMNAFKRPNDAEVLRHYEPLQQFARIHLDLTIIASVWILLPATEPGLLPVMLVLYVWFLATEIMVHGKVSGWHWLGPVGVSLSLIIFFLTHPIPHQVPLAIFLALTAVTLIALGRVIDRTSIKLIAARQETEQANVALQASLVTVAAERDGKTRFIAVASHDLLQPLQAAQLYFEGAILAPAPETRASAIEGARAALASTQMIVADMLDHLRLEAGVIVPRLESVSLGLMLAALAAERTSTAEAYGLTLRIVPTSGWVVADAALLRRALGNLIDNAIRHSGGTRILVGVRTAGGCLTIWVLDDGAGIAPAEAERLFDDFAQGRAQDGAGRGGFGLGLAMVRRSAAIMQGAAGVDIRWSGGAAFHLTLPAAAQPAIADRPLTLVG